MTDPQLVADIRNDGFFDSPADIESYTSATFWDTNRFDLTVQSRSPEFNVFGKSKIFATFHPEMRSGDGYSANNARWLRTFSLNNGPYYQHPLNLNSPVAFFGRERTNFPEPPEVEHAVVQHLMRAVSRNDWPRFEGGSFAQKYAAIGGGSADDAGVGGREADQTALNMWAYGKLAASRSQDFSNTETDDAAFRSNGNYFREVVNRFVNVGRIDNGLIDKRDEPYYPDSYLWRGEQSGSLMLPIFPGPFISEIAIILTPEEEIINGAATGNYFITYRLRVEIFNPPYMPGLGMAGNVDKRFRVLIDNLEISISPGSFNVNYLTRDDRTSGWDTFWLSSFQIPSAAAPNDKVTLPPNSRTVVQSGAFYVGSHLSSSAQKPLSDTTPSRDKTLFRVTPGSSVDATIRLRLGLTSKDGVPYQLIPVWSNASGVSGLEPPVGDGALVFEFDNIDVLDPTERVVGFEVADPRASLNSTDWERYEGDDDTMGIENSNEPSEGLVWDYWDMNDDAEGGSSKDQLSRKPYRPRTPAWRGTSIGMFSAVPNGAQRGKPNATLNFSETGTGNNPPDWVLLDLIGPTFPLLTDEVDGVSFMNSTAGKINVNTKIYPDNQYFTAGSRSKPLEALFSYYPNSADKAQKLVAFQEAGNHFDYPGSIAEVSGLAEEDNEANRERVIRGLASVIATQSNVFSIWGVTQTVKKRPTNTGYGTFESGDVILAEQRFQAVVQREVWRGSDDVVGSGFTDTAGEYSRLALNTFDADPLEPGSATVFGDPANLAAGGNRWATVDGTDAPNLPVTMGTVPYLGEASESIAKAANPLQPLIRYRILSFRYLND